MTWFGERADFVRGEFRRGGRAIDEGAVRAFGSLKVCVEDSNGTRTATLRISADRSGAADSRREFGTRLRGLLQAK